MIIQKRGPTTLLDRVRGPFVALAGVALLVSGAFFLVAGEFNVPSRLALGAALLFFGMYVAIDPAKAWGSVTSRESTYGTNALVMCVAFVGILVLANIL